MPQMVFAEDSVSAFSINTPNIFSSLTFYKSLGFQEMMFAVVPTNWALITDGAIHLLLLEETVPRLSIAYFVSELTNTVAKLKVIGIELHQLGTLESDWLSGFTFATPEGIHIDIYQKREGIYKPGKPTLLYFPPSDFSKPATYPNEKCGIFGELAIVVPSVEDASVFWSKIGFQVISRFSSPYPWAILADGHTIVGLHQSEHFNLPAITYFATDAGTKIAALEASGISDISRKNSNSATLATPDFQQINIYKLGM